MTAQGWWIGGGLVVAALQVFAVCLLHKFDEERPPLPSRKDVAHVRIVHKDVA